MRMTELWLVDLEAAAPALEALERDLPRLSGDDRARALRPNDARERRHRLVAYMGLRVVLERVAGAEVRGQRFVRDPRGKPHLGAGGTAFSLSHTDGLALIGVARAGTIGVDLERTRPLRMSSRRREEILAVAAGLAAVPMGDPASDEALLRAWCRLEAFAKARGEGLSHVLGELGLRDAGGRQLPCNQIAAAARRLARQSGLEVAEVKLPPGLYGAVAASGLTLSPRPRRFPAEAQAIRRILATRRSTPG
jgi:4'-phosphopantetheinyl transferase